MRAVARLASRMFAGNHGALMVVLLLPCSANTACRFCGQGPWEKTISSLPRATATMKVRRKCFVKIFHLLS